MRAAPATPSTSRFFSEQAALYGVEILDAHYFDKPPADDELDAVLRHFRDDLEPDALVYCGFGLNSAQLNPALERIGWDPPKIMNAAIMWALAGREWMAALDGWIGIEQSLDDHEDVEKNPQLGGDARPPRAAVRLPPRQHDDRPAVRPGPRRRRGDRQRADADRTGLAEGLERIKMMPSTLGGPRTYIGYGPQDHRGYRGDFMFMKQLRDGKFHFVAYHWPQWPVNAEP